MAKRSAGRSQAQVSAHGTAGSTVGAYPASIPDKLYFRIGEVAELCGVETYVLRFWQTEFPQLAPKKSGTGQRLYRRRDLEQALTIKHLLHEQGYTLAGARGVLAAEALEQRGKLKAGRQPELALAGQGETPETRAMREQADRAQARLARLRLELFELHSLLAEAPRAAHNAPVSTTRGKSRSQSGEPGLFAEEPGE